MHQISYTKLEILFIFKFFFSFQAFTVRLYTNIRRCALDFTWKKIFLSILFFFSVPNTQLLLKWYIKRAHASVTKHRTLLKKYYILTFFIFIDLQHIRKIQ